MSKPILISAFTFLIGLSVFYACQKAQSDPVSDAITATNEETGDRDCTYTPTCSLSISQTSTATGAWDLSVTVQRTGCTETEVACYRGDNLNGVCQNIGSSTGTFAVYPNVTYRLYYSGPYPRTFSIFNTCHLDQVTFTSSGTNPRVLSSSTFSCSDTGDCDW